MNLAAVIERLRENAPAFENRVAGVAELERALDKSEQRLDMPHAFVLPTGEEGELTRSTEGFSVVVALKATADRRGQAPLETIDQVREQIRLALTSWAPDSSHEPVVYGGAEFSGLERNRLWVEFAFSTVRDFGGILSYAIDLVAVVATTSTPAAVLAEFVTLIESTTSAVRLASDYLDQLPALLPGDLSYQLMGLAVATESDSNDTRSVLNVQLRVHKRLVAGDTERSYTEGAMQTDIAALLVPSLWRTAGVDHLFDDPTLDFPITRV